MKFTDYERLVKPMIAEISEPHSADKEQSPEYHYKVSNRDDTIA
jgi:hypothetical protein